MTLLELVNSIADPEFQALVEAQDYAAIADYLNLSTVEVIANPVEQGDVLDFPGMAKLRSLLSREDKAKALNLPSFSNYLASAYENPAVSEQHVDLLLSHFEDSADGKMTFLEGIRAATERRIPEALEALAVVMHQMGDLSQASIANIQAAMSEAIPDPNWSETIPSPVQSPARVAGLGLVSAIDVQEALN